VDGLVVEGNEGGGFKAPSGASTMVLLPLIASRVDVPIIAAGGVCDGRSMAAAMVLGAEGVQMGSRFVASEEASSHLEFKKAVIGSSEGDTILTMKRLTPVRMMKNKFFNEIMQAELRGATEDELKTLLGRARAKKGMFEGDLDEGELEIGQGSALLREILPASEIVKKVWKEFEEGLSNPIKKT